MIEAQTPDNFDAPETAAEALMPTPSLGAVALAEADAQAQQAGDAAVTVTGTAAAVSTTALAPIPMVVATAADTAQLPTATSVAAPTPLGTLPVSAPSTLDMLGALLLVVGLILVLGKLVKRVQTSRAGLGATLQIKSGVQVGGKERVVWMQAGDVQLLLGVSPGRVQTLHVFDAAALAEGSETQDGLDALGEPAPQAAHETPATRDFSDRLKTLLEHARARGVEVEHVAAPTTAAAPSAAPAAPRKVAPSLFSFRA